MDRARRILALLAMVASVSVAAPGNGLAKDDSLPSIVIDRETGAILSQNRPFDRWYPASLAKLMTVYVALRAKAAGEFADGSPVTISKSAAGQAPSSLGVQPGGQLRFDSALTILVVKSANDIAVAIAESVAGSVPAFVQRMNAEATRLGMTQTRFANPNGLHSAEQYTSARDMALLARRIFEEFPQEAKVFSIPAIRVGGQVHHSYNLLLERFAGADGMKTGFVCASGYNIIASATRNGQQLIAVVAGTQSQSERATTAARLLLEGFAAGSSGPTVEAALPVNPPAPAQSLRARMCNEKALKERYDPAAGEAVIESPYLEARRITREPLEVSIGGVDAPPAAAAVATKFSPQAKVPIPMRRPARPGDPV
jgi:D-alanyl-D-alanine carboxypeptidase